MVVGSLYHQFVGIALVFLLPCLRSVRHRACLCIVRFVCIACIDVCQCCTSGSRLGCCSAALWGAQVKFVTAKSPKELQAQFRPQVRYDTPPPPPSPRGAGAALRVPFSSRPTPLQITVWVWSACPLFSNAVCEQSWLLCVSWLRLTKQRCSQDMLGYRCNNW